MSRKVTTTVYRFNELSDAAKERARDWWRECENQDFDTSCLYDDFERVAKIIGITFDTIPVKLMGGGTRYDSKIWWSGFSSQGDGACFEGSYEYAKGSSKAIRHYAPLDAELHRIADALATIQKANGYKITAKISHSGNSNYYHKYTMQADVYKGEDDADSEISDAVLELMRDSAEWIYRSLEKEYEYRMSDEYVDDSITANEYEFNVDGTRA